MALTIQRSPDSYSPCYNDMTYLVSSTNTAQTNFYIKVYVDYFDDATTYVNFFEGNIYPIPGKIYAKFDPAEILRSYVQNDFAILNGSTTTGERSLIGEHYRIRFREYYGATPTAQGTEVNTTNFVFNGSFERRDYARYDENDYVINNSQLARFLTPVDEIWVRNTDTYMLTVMSKTTGGTALYTKLRCEKFDYSGASMGTTDITMLSPENDLRNRFQSVRCGPAQVGAANDVQYYQIWAASAANVQRTEKVTFWIDRNCTKFDRHMIYWPNSLGGIDGMGFPYVSRSIQEIERKTYNKPVGESTDAYAYNLNSYDSERNVFSTKTRNRMVLNTDFLNDTQAIFIKDLMSAPVVWWYDAEHSEFVSMIIDKSSYETRQAINDGLIQEEIVLFESLESQRQRC